MKLLPLVLLLSAFSSLTLSEVKSFKFCSEFFIRKPDKQSVTPTVFRGHQYKMICQTWKNKTRFATLYDTVRRIPVYSAYTYSESSRTRRINDWKIEPQLEDIKTYKRMKEMMDSPREVGNIKNQAVDSDYRGSRYSRGHVFPYSFAENRDQAESTLTLTNIAPQIEAINKKWATKVEEPMLKVINQSCRLDQNPQAYIVTGVVPGNMWIPITRNITHEQGINIPSHFWSAICCKNKNNIRELISKAYIAELENFKVRTPSIENLDKRLTKLYGQVFSVFPGLFQEITLLI